MRICNRKIDQQPKQESVQDRIRFKRCIRFLSFTLLLGGVLLVAACNQTEDVNSNLIHYSSMWKEGEPQATWLTETATAFTKQTGIKVDIDFKGREVLTKEKGNIIMNTPPDIIDQDINELTPAMLRKEILALPLDDLFDSPGPEGQKRLSDIFPKNLLKLYQKGGRNYFMPYEFITTLFVCDKNKLDKYGGVPKSWGDFIETGKRLLNDGISPLALDGNIYGYNAYYYCYALERIMGPGYLARAALDESGASFDEAGFLQAARLMSDISKAGLKFFQPGHEHSNYPQAQGSWAKGNAGSILCGTWIPIETVKLIGPDFKYGFYSFPEVTGGIGKSSDIEAILIGGMIPKAAKNPDNAKEFLKFMINKNNAKRFAENTISISARKDVGYPKILKDVEVIVKEATNFIKPYDGLMSRAPEWFASVFYPLDNMLMFGQLSPEEFIAQLKQKTIEFYKDNH